MWPQDRLLPSIDITARWICARADVCNWASSIPSEASAKTAHLDEGEVHVLGFQPGDHLVGDKGRHHRVGGALQDAHRAPHLHDDNSRSCATSNLSEMILFSAVEV